MCLNKDKWMARIVKIKCGGNSHIGNHIGISYKVDLMIRIFKSG